MIYVILVIILLDGILTFYFPSYFNNLNYFYPMMSLTLLVSLYDNTKNYFKLSLIIGFVYDLIYSNIIFYNTLIFFLLAKINIKIFNRFKANYLIRIIMLIINIILYDVINFFVVLLSQYNILTISDLIYKISHSLIFNIMSLFVLSFLLKKINLKHKV